MSKTTRVLWVFLGLIFLGLVVMHTYGCAMVTPALRDSVKIESCMLEKRVMADDALSIDEKRLRVQMCRLNRQMVGASEECGEVGR